MFPASTIGLFVMLPAGGFEKIFKKNQAQGREFLQQYLASPREYELRFAVVMLMNYYNDDTYIDNTLKELNNVRHEGYYVKMAVAWALFLYESGQIEHILLYSSYETYFIAIHRSTDKV